MDERGKKGDSRSLLRLAKLLKPYALKLFFCLICIVIANAGELLKPFLAKTIIDDFLINKKTESGIYSITGLGLTYMFTAFACTFTAFIQSRVIASVGQGLLHDMRVRVTSHIMHMPIAALDRYGSGRLITRATNDVETINEFYTDVMISLFKDVILLIGIVTVMLNLDVRLALISFICVPLIIGVTMFVRPRLRRNFVKMKSIIGRINGFFSENIAGMRIVQIFNRQKEKYNEFNELNSAYFKTTITQVFYNSILRPMMEVINSLIIALLIVFSYSIITGGGLFGGGMSGAGGAAGAGSAGGAGSAAGIAGIAGGAGGAAGVFEIGLLYAFTVYVKQFFEPINDLAEQYTTVQSAIVSADRIFTLLDEKGQEEPDTGTCDGPALGEVEFRDVWFAYNEDEYVLKGVSFKVGAGQKAAFVGATGAGKTTIINLLGRYYTPQRGQILIDGIPIEDWKLRALRESVAIVLQDVFLFTGTVADNIRLHSELPDSAVKYAIEASYADTFLNDADGPETKVTEQGLNFSTGQRQLISFARAIVNKPAILVLDEATANIDTETEKLIQDSIKQISSGRTAIFIAHRLSTIRECDMIYVLDSGQIVEQGDHNGLLSAGGYYARLIEEEK